MGNQLLYGKEIYAFYFGFLVVYIAGMFVPLMQNDSAQHASMAMKMVLNDDFLNIYKGGNPYLDKPHLHFWLAAISMKLFGINAFAYRIPAVLCLFLGAYATRKLANLLYENSNIGHVSALIFLSAQSIILSAHDVRTDAVLTGFIIFSIWKIIEFIKKGEVSSIILGGLAVAMAFSSKGLMAMVIIGFCVLAYLLYSREWRKFFNAKFFFLAFSFLIGILPILYAYYHQFGVEGVRFILLGQSVSRMTGDGFAPTNSDYFFFFHTLLWVFLPFSLVFYVGVFEKTRFFIKTKFKKQPNTEFLTLGGFWLVMLVFSLSKFKLPHYLNGLIAVIAIFTSAYIFMLFQKNERKKMRFFYFIQVFVIFVSTVAIALLAYYFVGIPYVLTYIVSVLLFCFLLVVVVKRTFVFRKFLLISLLFSISLNFYLNTQFYPVLTQYQGSLVLADWVKQSNTNVENIYMLKGDESWNFDFYTQRNTPRLEEKELKSGDMLLVGDQVLPQINRHFEVINEANNFRITRLSLKFINPGRRSDQLGKIYLVRIID